MGPGQKAVHCVGNRLLFREADIVLQLKSVSQRILMTLAGWESVKMSIYKVEVDPRRPP